MNILYDIAFIFFLFFYLPVFFLKRRKREGILIRLGFYPKSLKALLADKKNIWVHAVSVGEVLAAGPLIKALHENRPGYRVVLSVVTETGYRAAKKILPDKDIALYLPFDLSFIVKKALGYVRPVLLILMETELWPNLILFAHKMKVKVFLVNGRISDKSFKKYRVIRSLLSPAVKRVGAFCMQTQEYAERIKFLGAPAEKIKVTGNMKFDGVFQGGISSGGCAGPLAEALNIEPGQRLIVAGSTHQGEDELILNAWANLKKNHTGLKLVIVPRHIERCQDIARLVRRLGCQPVFFSRLQKGARVSSGQVVVVDVIGILSSIYGIAYMVFVGGSLVRRGGHNIVEPAALSKPIILGPHTFNFRDMVAVFLEKEAVVIAKDGSSLERIMEGLLKDETRAERLGQKAALVVKSNTGAAQRTLRIIEHEAIFS
ncbi:MAG: 3-deoxy-D-manno-octulosonic acid transferase [Candidatus Omnitrophica bacterium]|nr:3-deoxy-D-manno-octulosonic acid transferase [Candidatus Omnitrophota bacterium]